MTFAAIALGLLAAVLTWLLIGTRAQSAARLREATQGAERLAALSENYHQKLRALSESSSSAILMLNSDGTVVHANAMAESILSRERDSVVGHALIQATLSAEMQDFVVQATRNGQAQVRDFALPGDANRVLRASVYPFAEGLSGDAETMLVLVDITELRRLETVRQDFVANVSHELRTPLASIRAMAETLLDGARTDEEVAPRFLETIIRESDRLARLAQDLLVLSDAESKVPSREPLDLSSLVRDVAERFQPAARERRLELTLELDSPLPVLASRDQMEQVILNLVDNAIKFTSAEGKVSIAAHSLGDQVEVLVKDTGIGILAEHLPRIFERFYRVDKARSRDSGGTGLGLSIVRNIVEAHGGEVAVESHFNRGSTFSFRLPQAELESQSC